MPEGPQQESLAPDIVAALEKEPVARAFFDSLATFYRKAYLRWIDSTTRRPDIRAARIDEMVELLKAGKKQRQLLILESACRGLALALSLAPRADAGGPWTQPHGRRPSVLET